MAGGGRLINDDFKVSRTLTINLGVRYQIQQPLIEKYNKLPSLTSHGPQRFAGEWRAPRPLSHRRNDWAPRVGLAWRPGGSENFAIRASYGIFYDRLPGNDQSWQGISPPLNVGQSFAPPDPVVPSVNIAVIPNAESRIAPLPLGQFLFNLQGRRSPYIQQWTSSIQKALPAAYLPGGRLCRIQRERSSPSGTTEISRRRCCSPVTHEPCSNAGRIPNLGFILSDEGAGLSTYHALQSSCENLTATV